MADEKENVKSDRLDDAVAAVARGRLALGAAAFAAPGLTVKLMGLGRSADGAADPGRDYVTRMFAAREIALGAGYLLSRGPSRRLWVRLGLAVDAFDTVAALKSRGRLPLWVTAGGAAISAGATAVGAAKVARDLVR
ncbi:hypothetical protein [Actinomadura atramentaria]|uniref:hypothetical protein n=1 Tax=Actinomadura atramentaria TaxID=1990 RepID=UPI000475580E|nr:hypothetical protein [Actinomadura atramentaria]